MPGTPLPDRHRPLPCLWSVLRATPKQVIPDPAEHPTVPVWPIVGMAFGKKRSAILELARQGKLPVRVLRIRGTYRVATAELLGVLGQDQ